MNDIDTPRLTCCTGIYVHRPDCRNHRHAQGGPDDCAECRKLRPVR